VQTPNKWLHITILDSELLAINAGVFDPEGHPGKLLIDVKNKRLVRIDVPKLARLDTEDVKAAKNILRQMLVPSWSKRKIKALAKTFLGLSIGVPEKRNAHTRRARDCFQATLTHSDLPPWTEPVERIFFIPSGDWKVRWVRERFCVCRIPY